MNEDGNFLLFQNYKEYFEQINDKQCKQLILALFDFAKTGEKKYFEDDPVLNVILKAITDNITIGSKRRIASIENGKKGGRPKKNEKKEENNENNNKKI